jgi:hypothetical protein
LGRRAKDSSTGAVSNRADTSDLRRFAFSAKGVIEVILLEGKLFETRLSSNAQSEVVSPHLSEQFRWQGKSARKAYDPPAVQPCLGENF